MTDIVQICNQAAAHIAAKSKVQQVFPTPEDNPVARNCYLFFHQARKETLEAFDWLFASKEGTLALSGTPPTRWTYQYAWPADCLMPREIVPSTRTEHPIPFESSLSEDGLTKVILTDAAAASLRYTRDLDNTELWPDAATGALGWRLGMLIAVPVTHNSEMQASCRDGFKFSIAEARLTAAKGRVDDIPARSVWHAGR